MTSALRRLRRDRASTAAQRASTTPTPSLRRRVLVTVLVAFTVLLVVVGVAVDVALGARLRSDLSARVTDRADSAAQLRAQGYSDTDLVAALQGDAIRVRVTSADGSVEQTPGPPVGGRGDPDRGPSPRTGPPAPSDRPAPPRPGEPPPSPPRDALTVTRPLPGGGQITVLGDTTSITTVRRQLRWLMLAAGAVTVVLAALLMAGAVRLALRPLGAMVAVAREVTSGGRGARVRPRSPRTELGRAAESMDTMLDAVEAAEESARASASAARRAEAQTRQFLADAAHELRTPVAGLSAVAESVARDGTDHPERQARWGELLVQESQQVARLVDDLLDMARIDADPRLDPEPTDLAAIVDRVVHRARLLHAGTSIERAGADRLPVVVDAGRITQVITNLVDNATRATPRGRVAVSVQRLGTVAAVQVDDDGPGVPDADRDRIFDRLVRLDTARDTARPTSADSAAGSGSKASSGLGLSIARALARAHGGDVRCLPPDDAGLPGARFVLTLPVESPLGPSPGSRPGSSTAD